MAGQRNSEREVAPNAKNHDKLWLCCPHLHLMIMGTSPISGGGRAKVPRPGERPIEKSIADNASPSPGTHRRNPKCCPPSWLHHTRPPASRNGRPIFIQRFRFRTVFCWGRPGPDGRQWIAWVGLHLASQLIGLFKQQATSLFQSLTSCPLVGPKRVHPEFLIVDYTIVGNHHRVQASKLICGGGSRIYSPSKVRRGKQIFPPSQLHFLPLSIPRAANGTVGAQGISANKIAAVVVGANCRCLDSSCSLRMVFA